MSYFFGLSIAVLLATFTAWVQHYSWCKKERFRFEAKEEEMAIKLLNEISEIAHMRVHKQREQIWNIKGNINNCDVEKDYREAVSVWNEKFGGFMSRLEYSFSKNEADQFEKQIQRKFYEVNSMMNLGKKNISTMSAAKLEDKLNLLNSEIMFFIRNLMERIRRKDYSIFPSYKKVSFENRDRLTCEFLLLRLLGLC
jgi:hypothetical protein